MCEEDESAIIDKAQEKFNEAIRIVKTHVKTENRENILMMAGLFVTQELLTEKQDKDNSIKTLLDKVKTTLE
ncbi:hypothetical protein MNB_SUP05-5-568 [hydrothermal vent metagenome]|uniref:Cell division protein ZapA n=1 Tax=hydrothermal vent metagenome TaxID=652676 RepID=A0A1W1CJ79_9ZZZZ